MAMSGVSTGANEVAAKHVRHPNVKKLREAVAAGDVQAAREAFAKIVKNAKGAETQQMEQPGFRSEFKQLVHAVQSGDITTAQQALDSLVKERPTTYGKSAQLAEPFKKLGGEFKELAQAIRSGDASAAKTALTQIQLRIRGQEHHGKEPSHPDPVTILPVPEPISAEPDPVTIQPIGNPIAVDPSPITIQPEPSANPVLPLVR
ncbi:MAG: hypothetical protein U0163_13500 [Gemmatimonadaceae bacterium]